MCEWVAFIGNEDKIMDQKLPKIPKSGHVFVTRSQDSD